MKKLHFAHSRSLNRKNIWRANSDTIPHIRYTITEEFDCSKGACDYSYTLTILSTYKVISQKSFDTVTSAIATANTFNNYYGE